MKLTWFGESCFRIHAGGRILVLDAGKGTGNIDPAELRSGADQSVSLDGGLPQAEAEAWRPRATQRLLDAGGSPMPIDIWSFGKGLVVLDADGEAPLMLVAAHVPKLGKWADRAVVVLFGDAMAEQGSELLQSRSPRLIALAGIDHEVDRAFHSLAGQLDGTGMVALEWGMAVEV